MTPALIKEARRLSGLTQSQAALMIDASHRAWQQWEGGQRNMPAAKYNLFLIVTGVNPTLQPLGE